MLMKANLGSGDNSPYTVLELLAAKIPFIATRVGGIPELVDGGILVEPDSASALAAAVHRFAKSPTNYVKPAVPFAVSTDQYMRTLQALGAPRSVPEKLSKNMNSCKARVILIADGQSALDSSISAVLGQRDCNVRDIVVVGGMPGLSAGLQTRIVKSGSSLSQVEGIAEAIGTDRALRVCVLVSL